MGRNGGKRGGNRGRSKTPARKPGNAGRSRSRSRSRGAQAQQQRGGRQAPQQNRSRSRSRSRGPGGGAQLARAAGLNQGPKAVVRDIDIVPPNKVSFSIGTQSPTVYNSTLSQLAALIVAKIDSLSPGFWGTLGTTASITPQLAKMCLMHLVFSYFRDVGILQDATFMSSIPVLTSDVPVPVQLAYILQQYAPYRTPSGVEMVFTDTSTSVAAPTTGGRIAQAIATVASYGPVDVSPYDMTPSGNEFQYTTGTAVANWAAAYAATGAVMDVISGLIPCVPYSKIAKRAPDASAYAVVSTTYNQVGSSVPQFDPEVAQLLSPNTTWVASSYIKPLPLVSSPNFTTRGSLNVAGVGNYGLLLGAVEILQTCPYAPVTIKRALRTSKWGALRTMCPEFYDMDVRMWHKLCAHVAGLLEGADASGKTYGGVCIVLDSILYARLSQWAYLINPATGFGRMHSQMFSSLEVPPSIAMFVSLLGPVVHGGRLRLVLPTAGNGDWISLSSIANTMNSASTVALFKGQTVTPYAALNVAVGSYTFSAANYATPTGYTTTPVKSAESFAAYWAALYSNSSIKFISCDFNRSFGGLANYAFVKISADLGGGFKSGSSALVSYNYTVQGFCSDAPHSRADLAMSVFMGVLACPSVTSNLSYQTSLLNMPCMVGVMVNLDQSQDMTTALPFIRAKVASARSISGQSTDGDDTGAPVFAALAAIAVPVLSNVIPSVLRWVQYKLSETPAKQQNYYAEFGSSIGAALRDHDDDRVRRISQAFTEIYPQVKNTNLARRTREFIRARNPDLAAGLEAFLENVENKA